MTGRWALGVACLGLLAAPPAGAADQRLEFTAGAGGWYDSNLLQYSDPQIAEFESGLFPNRFSIESVSDFTFNPSLALTWELDEGHGRRHSVRLRGAGEFHAENPTADFHATSLTWREFFSRERRLTLRGYYLPSYYLRQLRDVETPFYERADYGLGIAGVGWVQRVRRGVLAGAAYQFERRVYDQYFPERTSNTQQGVLSAELNRLPSHGSVALAGAYRHSLADGRNYPSNYPDVSYHGWWVDLNGGVDITGGKGSRTGWDLGYRLERRHYDSQRPTDRSHYHRNDWTHTIEVGLRTQFGPHWTLRGFDQFEDNQADYGELVVLTSDPGSYTQNQVGIEITWTGTLWERGADSAQDTDENR